MKRNSIPRIKRILVNIKSYSKEETFETVHDFFFNMKKIDCFYEPKQSVKIDFYVYLILKSL